MSNPSQPEAIEAAPIDTSIKVSHNVAAVFLNKGSIKLDEDEALPYM